MTAVLADAGTSKTAYYTTAAQTGGLAGCGNHPQRAGLTCRTWHEDTTLPAVTTTYSRYLAPAVVTETSGTATRTTTTTFDDTGRVVTSHTVTTGLSGSEPVARTRTAYSPTTGLATDLIAETTSGTETGRITTGYEAWGRATTYTNTER